MQYVDDRIPGSCGDAPPAAAPVPSPAPSPPSTPTKLTTDPNSRVLLALVISLSTVALLGIAYFCFFRSSSESMSKGSTVVAVNDDVARTNEEAKREHQGDSGNNDDASNQRNRSFRPPQRANISTADAIRSGERTNAHGHHSGGQTSGSGQTLGQNTRSPYIQAAHINANGNTETSFPRFQQHIGVNGAHVTGGAPAATPVGSVPPFQLPGTQQSLFHPGSVVADRIRGTPASVPTQTNMNFNPAWHQRVGMRAMNGNSDMASNCGSSKTMFLTCQGETAD